MKRATTLRALFTYVPKMNWLLRMECPADQFEDRALRLLHDVRAVLVACTLEGNREGWADRSEPF